MKIERILLICIGVVIGLIACGTIAGLIKKTNSKPEVLISRGKAVNLAEPANTEVVAYYDLGSIRIVTLPDEGEREESGVGMVISPWVAYPEEDTVFYEEIARKRGVIKAIFTKYFAEKTRKEILSLGETKIKEDILVQINQQMALGKISDIYFTDFLFLE